MKIKTNEFSHHDRGSVMVLVVAVLGLLVVIGTIYITASRTERATSQALATSANTNLARDAVMAQVQQTIGNAMIDASGQIGGYATTPLTYGTQAARNYDYPDVGAVFGNEANSSVRDEPWLVQHLHPQLAATGYVQGTASINDFTLLTSVPYNPSSGKYDLPGSYALANTCNVVFDHTPISPSSTPLLIDSTTDDPPKYFSYTNPTIPIANIPLDDAYINLLPFSDASGIRYRFGLRILDTNRMANLNTGATDDTAALTDTTGTNITSLRLAPTSKFPTSGIAYFNFALNTYHTPADLGTSLLARIGGNNTGRTQTSPPSLNPSPYGASFNAQSWQQAMLRIENLPFTDYLSLYDTTDELELRSYGEFGTQSVIRPAIATNTLEVWPNTLGNVASSTITGNPARRNYTTYSFSREIRPFPNPAVNVPFTLTYSAGNYADGSSFSAPTNFPTDFASPNNNPPIPGYSAYIYPSSPAGAITALPKIPINPAISADVSTQSISSPSKNNWDSMYFLAMTATNIATAMERVSGYSHPEACSFAANYCSSLWSGLTQDTNVSGATAYYYPGGPSFVDSTGICIRTAINSGATVTPIGAVFGNGTSDLNTTTPTTTGGNTYLAYIAQPLINQVGAQSTSDGSTGPTAITINDSTIELVNPYNVALSMNGYHLTDTTTAMDIDLTQDDSGQKLYVPAKGYLVITTGTSSVPLLEPTATPTMVVAKYLAYALSKTGSSTLTLTRPFYDRSGTLQHAQVDQVTYAGIDAANSIFVPSTVAQSTPTNISVKRGDPSNALSLGSAATTSYGSPYTTVYTLWDRSTLSSQSVNPLTNIGDFDRIMRIGHVVNATGTSVPSSGTVADGLVTRRLGALGTAPDSTVPGPNNLTPANHETNEAIIYFDFYPNPQMFSNPAQYPFTPTPPVTADSASDLRAVYLLEHLTCIDRYSDNTINIGGGVRDINKLRLAGKINVNTASGDVLRAIPGLQASSNPDQMVANIIAYRTRSAGSAVSYNGQSNSVDYSSPANYPGHGFRTLSELLIPLSVPGVGSIDARGAIWANLFNLCTVRSDTFVVYGYLEAVRQNPAFSGTFDNAGNWYVSANNTTYYPTAGPTIDDPHNTGPLIRVARRRWVAIIDRSFSNYSTTDPSARFSLPRIVAIKDLPQ